LGQRVGFYLTDLQIQRVKKASKMIGLTVSEIIRRALDEWLENHKRKQKRTGYDSDLKYYSFDEITEALEKIKGEGVKSDKSAQSKKKKVS